jgi:hypothetical protein
LKRSRDTGSQCLAVRKATEATRKTRSEQGQSQDFQSDFIRQSCLKTPHVPRQRAIHHNKTSHHDLFSLFVIDDGAIGLWFGRPPRPLNDETTGSSSSKLH